MILQRFIRLVTFPARTFLQISMLIALVASQLGECLVRGKREFARYRGELLAR